MLLLLLGSNLAQNGKKEGEREKYPTYKYNGTKKYKERSTKMQLAARVGLTDTNTLIVKLVLWNRVIRSIFVKSLRPDDMQIRAPLVVFQEGNQSFRVGSKAKNCAKERITDITIKYRVLEDNFNFWHT